MTQQTNKQTQQQAAAGRIFGKAAAADMQAGFVAEAFLHSAPTRYKPRKVFYKALNAPGYAMRGGHGFTITTATRYTTPAGVLRAASAYNAERVAAGKAAFNWRAVARKDYTTPPGFVAKMPQGKKAARDWRQDCKTAGEYLARCALAMLLISAAAIDGGALLACAAIAKAAKQQDGNGERFYLKRIVNGFVAVAYKRGGGLEWAASGNAPLLFDCIADAEKAGARDNKQHDPIAVFADEGRSPAFAVIVSRGEFAGRYIPLHGNTPTGNIAEAALYDNAAQAKRAAGNVAFYHCTSRHITPEESAAHAAAHDAPACQQQQAQAPARIYDNAERVIDEAHIGGDFGAYCRGLIDTMRGQLTDAARRLRQHDNKGARAACDNAAAAYKRLPAGSSDPYQLATHICRAQEMIRDYSHGAAINAIEDRDFACAATGKSPGALKALDMLCDYGIAAFANNALQTQRRRIADGIGGAMDWQDNEPPYVPTPDPLAVWDQRAADYWRQRWQRKDKQAGHVAVEALFYGVLFGAWLLFISAMIARGIPGVLIAAHVAAFVISGGALAFGAWRRRQYKRSTALWRLQNERRQQTRRKRQRGFVALPARKETKPACPPATGAATGGGYIVAWRDPAIGLWCFAAKYFCDDVAPIFSEDNKPSEAFVFNTRLAAWQWAAEYFTKAPEQKRRVKVLPAACGARWQDKVERALDARYQQQGAPGIAEVKAAGGLLNYWQGKADINAAAMQQQQAQDNAPLPPRPRYYAVVRYGDLPGGGCERLAACKTAGGYNTSAAAMDGGRIVETTGNAPPFLKYYSAETQHGFIKMRRYCGVFEIVLMPSSYFMPTPFAAKLAIAIYNAARRALPAHANTAAINDYLATHGERLRLECKPALQAAIEAEAAK